MTAALRLVEPQAASHDWLSGEPMDPLAAESLEPLPTIPGYPMLTAGAAAHFSAPTGAGKSLLLQTMAYDAALLGIRTIYLGFEVTGPEFNARCAEIASCRGHAITADLRHQLARVRYLPLTEKIAEASRNPQAWSAGLSASSEVLVIDPLSASGTALGLDFNTDRDYLPFYDRLVQPYVTLGGAVALIDNVGHEVRDRAKGASGKGDRADLTFTCKRADNLAALIVTADKTRSIRTPHRKGDKWIFDRETLSIQPRRITLQGVAAAEIDDRPHAVMERISDLLDQQPGLGRRQLRERVTGGNAAIDKALHHLIDSGHVEARRTGNGRRTEHHLTRPYKADRDHRAQTVSDTVTVDTAPATVPVTPHTRRVGGTVRHGEDGTPGTPTVSALNGNRP